jgi:hypothetical protein
MQKQLGKSKRLSLECIEPNAAGIDVGATEIFVAVPPDRDPQPVRCFKTFTDDLRQMAAWLVQCGITTVAMESTGVYWIPPYEILEEAGIRVCLVNSKHVKHVPGRKSDVQDCQWLQYLHSVGLLRASFRPDERDLRHPLVEPPPRQPDRERRRPCAAYAQGADPDESADSPRPVRHHRTQRHGHHRSHRGRRALASSAGRSVSCNACAQTSRR